MRNKKVIIIGAGIAGLAAAMKLSTSGINVEVYEQHEKPGGKIRYFDSKVGPIDAGPTVLTMYYVFADLFHSCGYKIDEKLKFIKEEIIARHWWRDGSSLDLYSCFEKNLEEIKHFAGNKSALEFEKFDKFSKDLFGLFKDPIIMNSKPDIFAVLVNGFKNIKLLKDLLIKNKKLYGYLNENFSDHRLKQLFSRYSTYVGGSPFNSPSILSLIWHVECQGVWRIAGGMYDLVKQIETISKRSDASFFYKNKVKKILMKNNKINGIELKNNKVIDCDTVIFNGDPKALFDGLLGDEIQNAVSNNNINKRSLSAYVWSFAAKTQGLDLLHHNVLFNKNYKSEFDDIKRGEIPKDPTLYICAQGSINNPRPKEKSLGRFEIIINGSPTYNHKKYNKQKEYTKCKEITFSILDSMGLKMDLKPTEEMLTTPKEFEQLFPGSQGSLYGRTPHGISSTFMRPRNKSKIKGLLLAGGGTHPGAGIPMACLSGKHAAEMILKDLSLT